MITQEYLKSILDYDPLTGVFTWKERAHVPNKWNGRFSGTIAGSRHNHGYIIIRFDKKRYYAHRLAWLFVYGRLPETEIDHTNGIKYDNRIINLREATHKQNLQNQIRSQKNSNCNYLGVNYEKDRNKYLARIKINNKQKNLGRFSTPEAAHEAYLKAKRELHEFGTL